MRIMNSGKEIWHLNMPDDKSSHHFMNSLTRQIPVRDSNKETDPKMLYY